MADERTEHPRAYVSWRELDEYVRARLDPLEKQLDAHDAWHRGRLEEQIASGSARLRSNRTTFIAAIAVLVSAAGELFRSVGH